MNNTYFKISLNIFLVFVIAIFASYIPELIPDFFGDWTCEGSIYDRTKYTREGCLYGENVEHNPMLHWGWRHWLFMFMSVCLFIVQIFRIIEVASKESK